MTLGPEYRWALAQQRLSADGTTFTTPRRPAAGISRSSPMNETRTYPDGTTVTGPGPLPEHSPASAANSALIPGPVIARSQLEQQQLATAPAIEPTIITPTVGRIVWYWPHGRDRNASVVDLNPPGRAAQPMAATVVFVHGVRRVNLLVTDHEGRQHARREVQLVQEGDERPAYGVAAFATWMPYQVGQAKRAAAGSGA